MKPAWDQLHGEYKDSNVIIGDVDCTVHRGLCSEHGVRGYPTVKYFMAGNKEGQKYQGGRDVASLKAFVDKTFA